MTYKTKQGSIVNVSGKYNGIIEIEFDWFEEGACIEASENVHADLDLCNPMLYWSCECCGDGQAQLIRCDT